jgi:hypothetical protein
MTRSHRSRASTTGLLAALVFAVAGSGLAACDSSCRDSNATCGTVPPGARISGFEVVISTGEEGANSDIHFCYRRDSSIDPQCFLLDEALYDDFEPWHTDHYTMSFSAFDGADLEKFWIWNEYIGIHDCWDIVALQVDALLEGGGRETIYVDREVTCSSEICADGSFLPKNCPY